METIKVVLIGESGVGKTSIIQRYVDNIFDPNVILTSSAQFISKTVELNDEQSIKFDIWDTAGQEKFRALAKIFYKDAKAIILVYDITNKESFDKIKNYWFKEIEENSLSDVILAIVGNKSDLYELEQVNDEEGKKFADEKKAIFKNVSALNSMNIDNLFIDIAKKYFNPNYDYQAEDKKIQEEYIKRKKKEKENETKEEKINLSYYNNNDDHTSICC
jgi:small GTP-binding protein